MTQLNQAADRAQFVVLYPEQDVKRFGQCWEWFAPSNQRPAEGEPAIIVDLVKKIAETFHLSRPQTFVMGFSAGGAFASTLATCYSDRFAAAAIHSGIPYAATDELSEIFSVLAGNYASEAYLEKTKIAVSELGDKGLPVPTISLHGTLDKTVNPDNQIKLVKQALLSHHLLAPQERVDLIAASGGDYDDVYSLMTKVYGVVSTRRELVRMVSVFGLGHAWSGGPADSNFSENNAPDATGIFLKFFEAQLPGGLCEKEFRPH
jgi:poly(hydroxyalkanoate) depolymerase family esterase